MKKKTERDAAAVGDADLEIPQMTRAQMCKGILGKRAVGRPNRVVGLDPDVARVFRDSESVNKVLRALIEFVPIQEKKRRKSAKAV